MSSVSPIPYSRTGESAIVLDQEPGQDVSHETYTSLAHSVGLLVFLRNSLWQSPARYVRSHSSFHCFTQFAIIIIALAALARDVIRHELMWGNCRFFLQNWPDLCWLAFDGQQCFGTVVCKQDKHGEMLRGYIAMLVVTDEYRGLGVGLISTPQQMTAFFYFSLDNIELPRQTPP